MFVRFGFIIHFIRASKQSSEGRAYLGLKIDDPSFTAPIYANLFDDEGGDTYSLIWSRSNRRGGE